MISRPSEMPKNAVFSKVCGLLPKSQMYRNLSQIGVISHQNGVVNGVVDLGTETSNIILKWCRNPCACREAGAWVLCVKGYRTMERSENV